MTEKKLIKQKELAEWQKKNFTKGQTGNCDCCVFRLLAGMIEELGELAHPLLKNAQGLRGVTTEQMKEEVGDAYGDVNIWGCQLLNQLGIDAEEAIKKAIEEVLKRDWVSDPVTGKTDACHKGGKHNWKPMKEAGWKKCTKCKTMVNYSTEE